MRSWLGALWLKVCEVLAWRPIEFVILEVLLLVTIVLYEMGYWFWWIPGGLATLVALHLARAYVRLRRANAALVREVEPYGSTRPVWEARDE